MQRIFAMDIGMQEACELTEFYKEPFKSAKNIKDSSLPTGCYLRKYNNVHMY